MAEQAQGDQSDTAAGATAPRDEAAIRRKIYHAVSQADDLFRVLLTAGLFQGWEGEARRVRGLLAEWREERG